MPVESNEHIARLTRQTDPKSSEHLAQPSKQAIYVCVCVREREEEAGREGAREGASERGR
eukprot:6209829-Pleurochrysis_carterae.AAC.2